MMLTLVIIWTTTVLYISDDPQVPLGTRLTHDIQASLYTRQPTLWGTAEQAYEIKIEWAPPELSHRLVYQRQVRRSPDGGDLLLESWRLHPDDLTTLLDSWGHPDRVTWSQILGSLPNGRLIASQSRGLLLVVREYPLGSQSWRKAPFPLNAIPTQNHPDLALAIAPDAGKPFDEAHESSKFADFFADIFIEELLDREGISIRISKHWDIEGRFSRLSPLIRVERRIRLDFGGTYSVFDLYTIGGEFLLGSRREDDARGDFSETGAFLDLEKKVVVIRRGFEKWYHALFAKPLPLRKIPYSQNSLDAFPMGVRVVFPSTAGLTLTGQRTKPTHVGNDIPLKMEVFAGLNGTFFISLAKTSQDILDFHVGGRIERLGEVNLKMRPDFDGAFDPLRLLMGTLSQLRANKTKGTSLFMQRHIDLKDPEEVGLYRQSIRRGLKFTGFPLGAAAIFNVAFHREWDTFFVEEALQNKLPEIQWERTYLSHYSHFENYAKLGIRPLSGRSRTYGIDDDWVVNEKESPEQKRGRSISLTTRRNLRLPGRLSQRTIQANGIIGKDSHGKIVRDQFLEIVDLTDRTHMSHRAYRRITGQMQACFFPCADMSELASWTPQKTYHDVQIGYRIVLTKHALEVLAHKFATLRKTNKNHPLSRWLFLHPILRHRLERFDEDPEAGFLALSKLIFKLAKRRGPIHCLFEDMDLQDYMLEWRGLGVGTPQVYGRIGESIIPDSLVRMLRDWESLGVLDDLFVERNFKAHLQ